LLHLSKKYINVIFIFFFSQTFCQKVVDTIFKVEYENIITIEDDKKKSSSIPVYFELITSNRESNFKQIERVINTQSSTYFFQSDKGLLYKDLIGKKYLKEEDLGNKKYLIKDDLLALKWSISNKDSIIINEKVFLATLEKDNKSIKAWFKPSEISNGPYLYNGLPGVILYLEEIFYHKDENNTVEKQIFKAVDIKDVNNKKIKIPEERKNIIIVSKKEMEFLKKEYYDKQMNYFKSKSEVKN